MVKWSNGSMVTFSLYFSVDCLPPHPLPHSISGSCMKVFRTLPCRWQENDCIFRHIRVARVLSSTRRDIHHIKQISLLSHDTHGHLTRVSKHSLIPSNTLQLQHNIS